MTTDPSDRDDKDPDDLPPPRDIEGDNDDDYEHVEDLDTDEDEDEDETASPAEPEDLSDDEDAQVLDIEDLESDEIDSGIEETDEDADLLDVEDLDTEPDQADVEDEVVTGEPDEALIEQVQDETDAEEEAHVQTLSWYQNRWRDIQTDFVDTPRDAVANADRLVADVIEQLTTALADERNKLAAQWSQDDVSTEDLRVAFQNYRAFFERLTAS